ncbi:MAG TPA: phosphatidate cytidylyltransferase, partial [Methylomirabilota bacterium]|nr:phosphatidate cytidylyltransferase [Methylomirabilota bacterium]
ALLAFREYVRVVGLWLDRGTQAVGYLLVVVTVGSVAWVSPGGARQVSAFMLAPAAVLLTALAFEVARGRAEQMLQRCCLVTFGTLYCGWLLGHLAYLRNALEPTGPILFFLFLVCINDVAAFVSGRSFGRQLLRRRLSPTKTWQGAAGALVAIVLVAPSLGWLLPGYRAAEVVLLGAAISVGGTVGDLALSGIKRDLGIKDWSSAIPGHGGVLDRVNSVTFAVPLMCHYAVWVHGIAS